MEQHDLNGKVIVPFATSGSSSIANSSALLRESYPKLQWREGKLHNHADAKSIALWIAELRKNDSCA